MTDAQRRAAFAHLLQAFQTSQGQVSASRWLVPEGRPVLRPLYGLLLEASHVLGQQLLDLHWRSHCWMLRHALQLRDVNEIAGQLLRLALVPAGHLLDLLPRGNTGRATVPATLPMEMPPAVALLIGQALRATRDKPVQRHRA